MGRPRRARWRRRGGGTPVPRIVKDCFGTVISTLSKMKECVRCELLSECRSMNWQSQDAAAPPAVLRRPAAHGPGESGDAPGTGPSTPLADPANDPAPSVD
jgi:hypothetical protein